VSDDADEEDLTVEVDLGGGSDDAPEEGETQADDATPDADGEDDAPEAGADAEDGDTGPRRPASIPQVRDDPTADDGDAGAGDASDGAPVEADPGTAADESIDDAGDDEPADATATPDADGREASTDAAPDVKADTESDAEADTDDEVAAEPETEAETDSGVDPDADAEPEAEADVDPESPQGRMERALTAVRREGRKAAAIYAVADGVAAMLAVNVVLATVASAVPYPTVLAVLAGVAVLGGEFWLRTRRSLVERFEAANPEIAGPLRTARDAVESSADNRMAARLYEETLERLRDASGVALVNGARVAATGIVVVVLCLASLQVSVVGLSFLGDDTTTSVDDRPEAVTPEPDGLRDGGAVLGDPDPVDRGSEDVTAEVEANEGDGPIENDRNFPSDGGGAGGADVETRQAAFSRPDRVENAELVREYNVRIREQE